MNSIKQEALAKINYEYRGFERLEKIYEKAYDQGVADERKRAAGVSREHSCGEIVDTGCPEAIATEIERGDD